MEQKDKELLLKDLSARLPYSVKCYIEFEDSKVFPERTLMPVMIQDFKEHEFVIFKPYLRPMSSMTEEESEEYRNIDNGSYSCPIDYAHIPASDRIDWLNKRHFDYRGLIERGLALEAPKGMYNN